jgi:hypothetical protein
MHAHKRTPPTPTPPNTHTHTHTHTFRGLKHMCRHMQAPRSTHVQTSTLTARTKQYLKVHLCTSQQRQDAWDAMPTPQLKHLLALCNVQGRFPHSRNTCAHVYPIPAVGKPSCAKINHHSCIKCAFNSRVTGAMRKTPALHIAEYDAKAI